MSIKILSPDVVNQIAAGEVVERPAHLVKELIENSLDAHATQIQIEIASGGQFIKITDNGQGIVRDELVLALHRHATSKINLTDDLWKLATYGFRGEALASVAAVAQLNLISKPKSQAQAYQIKSDFGQVSEVMEASLSDGTQIVIESLFENVPARLKFLKSDAAEVSQIRQVIKALALVYYHVEFKFIESGRLDLIYKSTMDQKQRVQDVLGLEKIFAQSYDLDHFKIKAYYSSPHEVQRTSKNIWIFTQKRWVQDRALQAAVMDSYRSLLMHGEYPFVVIDLECATDQIDVNIHPTKSQVKFQDASKAFRAVHGAIRIGLEQAPWLDHKNTQTSPGYNQSNSPSEKEHRQQSFIDNKNREYSSVSMRRDDYLTATQFKTKTSVFDQIQNLKIADDDVKNQSVVQSVELSNHFGYWSSLQVLGQLNLTYIICQKNDRMVLIDQHAAHERVAFEKLMRKWKSQNSQDQNTIELQNYLFPLAIDLSVEKAEALMKCESDIRRMGIEVELLGPSVIGIKSAPLFIKESALPRVFEKMAQDLLEYGGSYSLEKSIIDIFASIACHSVVRAGQSLSLVEMMELLKSMDEFPLSSFCPHGRPVSVDFTFYDIEKSFGRLL